MDQQDLKLSKKLISSYKKKLEKEILDRSLKLKMPQNKFEEIINNNNELINLKKAFVSTHIINCWIQIRDSGISHYTHRIANLIEGNSIDPYNILAVTFTNKAAKEMKARLEVLLAQELALNQFGQPWTTLKEIDQN